MTAALMLKEQRGLDIIGLDAANVVGFLYRATQGGFTHQPMFSTVVQTAVVIYSNYMLFCNRRVFARTPGTANKGGLGSWSRTLRLHLMNAVRYYSYFSGIWMWGIKRMPVTFFCITFRYTTDKQSTVLCNDFFQIKPYLEDNRK